MKNFHFFPAATQVLKIYISNSADQTEMRVQDTATVIHPIRVHERGIGGNWVQGKKGSSGAINKFPGILHFLISPKCTSLKRCWGTTVGTQWQLLLQVICTKLRNAYMTILTLLRRQEMGFGQVQGRTYREQQPVCSQVFRDVTCLPQQRLIPPQHVYIVKSNTLNNVTSWACENLLNSDSPSILTIYLGSLLGLYCLNVVLIVSNLHISPNLNLNRI